MNIEHDGENIGKYGETNISKLVPEIVRETNEEVTDAYIDLMLSSSEDSDKRRIELLKQHKGKCVNRISQLENVKPQINKFLEHIKSKFPKTEGDNEQKHIHEALALMLKLHINQDRRVAIGDPFISHPTAVANKVLDLYDEDDASFIIIAALLHDSIEDQSNLLSLGKLPEYRTNSKVTGKQLEREDALNRIGHIFGMRVMNLIRMLTSPEELKGSKLSQDDKNKVYMQYIRDIFYNELDEKVVVIIKWADLRENALTIGKIYDRAQNGLKNGDNDEYKYALEFYLKLKKKYEPALHLVRHFFENIEEDHPLFKHRIEAINEIDDVLENQYTLA